MTGSKCKQAGHQGEAGNGLAFDSLTRQKKHMRGAFIVQLGPGTKPDEGQFEGWVQEVDLWKERRFRNTGELLQFLGERFEVAKAVAERAKTAGTSGAPPVSSKRPVKKETAIDAFEKE